LERWVEKKVGSFVDGVFWGEWKVGKKKAGARALRTVESRYRQCFCRWGYEALREDRGGKNKVSPGFPLWCVTGKTFRTMGMVME
jgi:hypothetical protein